MAVTVERNDGFRLKQPLIHYTTFLTILSSTIDIKGSAVQILVHLLFLKSSYKKKTQLVFVLDPQIYSNSGDNNVFKILTC